MQQDAASTTQHAVDESKLQDVILFFVRHGETDLGKTKLMKLLYFADFGHYRQHYVPITGAAYQKWPQGPVAPRALDLLREMVRDGLIRREDLPVGTKVMQTHVMSHPDWSELATLDEAEKATVREVWKKWRNATTNEIVSASHKEPGWLSTPLYDVIPYHTALFG